MKKISLWCLILLFTATLVSAQESATQQQIDKLGGQIQDILDAQAQQSKRIEALEKEISDLRDKVNTPAPQGDFAGREDLKKLAEQVQEIDQKRQDDRELILKQIADLAHTTAVTSSPGSHHSCSSSKQSSDTSDTHTSVPATQYEYVVKPGDNLGIILKAYRDKGVKVTLSQFKAANPKVNPDVLIPGKTIYIPDAAAK